MAAALQCDIGLVGLAVMGENLVLNLEDHGFAAAVFNRTTSKVDEFVGGRGKGKRFVGCHSPQELVAALKRPRRLLFMVKAGPAVDQVIASLVPLLEAGDILVDGGNSYYADTDRRQKELAAKGLHYLGVGVSGGEEGARHGPSMMPGGAAEAWPHVKAMFQAISAKVGPNHDIPCCEWVGPGGSGHYVKMVHNGIEYGDMQLICEAYALLKELGGLTNAELRGVFDAWNRTDLDSYLIEITRDIFGVKDPHSGDDLVDRILDKAGQKGTGKWTSQLALDLGVPTTLVTEAVFARCVSAQKEARVRASKVLVGPDAAAVADLKKGLDRTAFVEDVRQALYASKITSYAQGFVQLAAAAAEGQWGLNYGAISLLWRGGCIIRARFLERIKEAFDRDPKLENLLLDPYFQKATAAAQPAWRRTVSRAALAGIPAPAFSAALTYYDGYRSPRLPANLLQAQRDYFGAHTFERTDQPGSFHHDWIGSGNADSRTA